MAEFDYPNDVGTFIHVGEQTFKIVGQGNDVAKAIAKSFAAGEPARVAIVDGGGEILIIPGSTVWFDHPQNSMFW